MNYTVLRAELLADPIPLGYSGLTDALAAAKLNATDTGRSQNRTAVPPSEIFNAIDNGAWPTTAILQNKLAVVLAMPTIDASNANTRGILGSIFPASGVTQNTNTRLLALSSRVISRAEELGLEPVTQLDVNRARSGVW